MTRPKDHLMEQARDLAKRAINTYGEAKDWDRLTRQGIRDDHPAVQAAMMALKLQERQSRKRYPKDVMKRKFMVTLREVDDINVQLAAELFGGVPDTEVVRRSVAITAHVLDMRKNGWKLMFVKGNQQQSVKFF